MTTEQLYEVFRSNLRDIREELGLSQSELARRIGKKPSYICDLERSRREGVSLATIGELAEGLGVNPATLLSTIRSPVLAAS